MHPHSKTFAALVLGALAAAPAQAQRILAPEMVVTATSVPTPEEQVANKVSVITREEIERRQYRTVSEALQSLAPLSVVRSGGVGNTTSVFARGTNSNHSLVLIDGIEANDPSSPTGAMDFAFLAIGDVERIEVLYGSQGGLYGSDAVGAVINVITKAGGGKPTVTGMVEGGSYGTFNQAAGVSGGAGRLGYRADLQHLRQAGLSIADARQTPAGAEEDDDVHDSLTVSTKLDLAATERLGLTAVARHVRAKNDLDVSQTGPSSDNDSRERVESTFLRGEGRLELFDGMAEARAGFSHTRYHRFTAEDIDPFLPFDSLRDTQSGQRTKFDLKADVTAIPYNTFTVGLETEEEAIQGSLFSTSAFGPSTSVADASVNNDAIFLQDQIAIGGRYFATLGARLDDHEQFGRAFTWRAGAAYLHRETDTRLRAAYSTGYKAPTLANLYGNSFFFGIPFLANPNLVPETSKTAEAGVEQKLFGGRASVGMTAYQTVVRNLITLFTDPGFTFGTNINTGKAIVRGIEVEAKARPAERVDAALSYAYTVAKDAVRDTELLRRPRRKVTGELAWRPADDVRLGVTVVHVGRRVDFDTISFAQVKTASYTVVNLLAAHDVGPGVILFGRIENLFDRDYREPDFAVQPGLGAYGGVRVRF